MKKAYLLDDDVILRGVLVHRFWISLFFLNPRNVALIAKESGEQISVRNSSSAKGR